MGLFDKLDLLFTDVETEGRKQGYAQAAAEYEKVFRSIKCEYEKTKELIESQKNMYDRQSDALIEKLEALEKQKKKLENQVRKKTKEMSDKYAIPEHQLQTALASGTSFVSGPIFFDVIGIIIHHKERRLREAKQHGYIEARKLYVEKIDRLKKDLAALKIKGNSEIEEMIHMINEILEAISGEQMKIAELKMLGDEYE